jgi:hypothetical protein
MSTEQHIIPRIAIQSIATGLIMMAAFTMIWAMMGHFGLAGRDNNMELIVFGLLAILFISRSIYFFGQAKKFPVTMTGADKERGKKEGKWFGIIFGAEGLGIFIAINIVRNIGHDDLTIPVIALVVGLHFYPLAKVFKRKLDYYLATWSTLIAILSIIFTLNHTLSPNDIFAFTGIGLAIATSSYGIYMMIYGRSILNKATVQTVS